MRVIHLALKDLLQIVHDPKSLLFLLALPVIFTWLMGVIFDTNRERDPRLPVGFVNQDDSGQLGVHLNSLLAASETIRPVHVAANQLIGNLPHTAHY